MRSFYFLFDLAHFLIGVSLGIGGEALYAHEYLTACLSVTGISFSAAVIVWQSAYRRRCLQQMIRYFYEQSF